MELAAKQGIELQFDKYRRDWSRPTSRQMLRVTYLLHVGRGYHSLGDRRNGNSLPRASDRDGGGHTSSTSCCSSARRRCRTHEARVAAPDLVERSCRFWRDCRAVVDGLQNMREVAGIALAKGPQPEVRQARRIAPGNRSELASALTPGDDVSAARRVTLRRRARHVTAGGQNKGGDSQSEQHQRAAGH